jgi:prevent-host-death family protein
MISVGLFEAKTNLSALIEKVAAGEEIQITRHGKPVAKITNCEVPIPKSASDLVARINALADKATLGDNNWKEMRDYGRRW